MEYAGIVAVIAPDQIPTILGGIAVCLFVIAGYFAYSLSKKKR